MVAESEEINPLCALKYPVRFLVRLITEPILSVGDLRDDLDLPRNQQEVIRGAVRLIRDRGYSPRMPCKCTIGSSFKIMLALSSFILNR